jgi:hypothetical protein
LALIDRCGSERRCPDGQTKLGKSCFVPVAVNARGTYARAKSRPTVHKSDRRIFARTRHSSSRLHRPYLQRRHNTRTQRMAPRDTKAHRLVSSGIRCRTRNAKACRLPGHVSVAHSTGTSRRFQNCSNLPRNISRASGEVQMNTPFPVAAAAFLHGPLDRRARGQLAYGGQLPRHLPPIVAICRRAAQAGAERSKHGRDRRRLPGPIPRAPRACPQKLHPHTKYPSGGVTRLLSICSLE